MSHDPQFTPERPAAGGGGGASEAQHHQSVTKRRDDVVVLFDRAAILAMVVAELFQKVVEMGEYPEAARLQPVNHVRDGRLDAKSALGKRGVFEQHFEPLLSIQLRNGLAGGAVM